MIGREYLNELDLHDAALRVDHRSLKTLTQGLGLYVEDCMDKARYLNEQFNKTIAQTRTNYINEESKMKQEFEKEIKELQEKAQKLEREAKFYEEKEASLIPIKKRQIEQQQHYNEYLEYTHLEQEYRKTLADIDRLKREIQEKSQKS